jgi:hypothetical protein
MVSPELVLARNGGEFNGYKSAHYANCCKDCISDKDKKETDDAWRNTCAALYSAGEPAYTAGGATFFIDMSNPAPSWILDRIKEKKMKEVEIPGCNKFKFFKTE